MKKPAIEELFELIPEVPKGFSKYCYGLLPKIPIYYRRHGKLADCNCGKCGRVYVTDEIPVRGEKAVCSICGNEGFWEWQKVTKSKYSEFDVMLLQCAADGTLVIRMFRSYQKYKQGCIANEGLEELKRIFLRLGSVYYYNQGCRYTSDGWGRAWAAGKGNEAVDRSRLYPGWQTELHRSSLKYCMVEKMRHTGYGTYGVIETLIAFANNPALEMYDKVGMERLVSFLIWKEGKTKLVKRRNKTVQGQLGLQDMSKINRLVQHQGDTTMLKILQKETKEGRNWTEEQELFLITQYRYYDGEKKIENLLKYMTLQQLMNRVEKYKNQGDYKTDNNVLSAYCDYLEMRKTLGYDMTNEVYLYPKNLKEKHDQMAKEQVERKDELHIRKMEQAYPKIAENYVNIAKKYTYADENYLIRPARNAGEIVMEGRLQHHCVGCERYLSSHNSGQTYILLLRKLEAPEQPYYTIEVRGNNVIQWYGAYDKKPDEEQMRVWLTEYMEFLKQKRRKIAV